MSRVLALGAAAGARIMIINSDKKGQRPRDMRYAQVKAYIAPETAETFKAKCMNENVSVSFKLGSFIEGEAGKTAAIDAVETRKQRRKAVNIMIGKLNAVIRAEAAYQGRIPENLGDSSVYDASEQTIEILEEALNLLSEAY